MTTPSSRQLRRFLQLLPNLSIRSDIPIEEAVRLAGVKSIDQLTKELFALVDSATHSSRISEDMQICIDDETVSVFFSHFRRPMRLTVPELRALELGLSMLRHERTPDQHAILERAGERLRETLVRIRGEDLQDGIIDAVMASPGDRKHLSILQVAQKEKRKVLITHRSLKKQGAVTRELRPYGLVFYSGRWYVVGHCEKRNAMRMFRLDRIENAELSEDVFEVPESFTLDSLKQKPKLLEGEPVSFMKVRYSPVIARWIAEREGVDVEEDGSLIFEHPVHDISWAISHVLQYGPEAEVVSPPEMRNLVFESLTEMNV